MIPTQGQGNPVHQDRDVPVGGAAQTRLSLSPRVLPDEHQRHLAKCLLERGYRLRIQSIETHLDRTHPSRDREAATGHHSNPVQPEAVGEILSRFRPQ